ncbi:MAG: hypothetical protein LDLANPLL_02204 [Turneriella sp.]|nr:hypothetical protein [Turneriella sp.]
MPITGASEVELNYVKDFLQKDNAPKFAAQLKEGDRGLYIGADIWPRDAYIEALSKNKEFQKKTENISFLVDSGILQQGVSLPKGFFSRRDLWRKYAELTGHTYSGSFFTHYLDTRPIVPRSGEWKSIVCVHETGSIVPSSVSLVSLNQGNLNLRIRENKHLKFLGSLVCINGPKANAILELHAAKTDVVFSVSPARFSFWNEAVPLYINLNADNTIYAPLEIQIKPEVNETQTEFFLQGERVTCVTNRCRKKNARLLLPAIEETHAQIILAVRGGADSYFRGTLHLMSGTIEIATAPLLLKPHSWISEVTYAIKNPSEYRRAFFIILALIIFGVLLIYVVYRQIKRAWKVLRERRKVHRSVQSNAMVEVHRGDILQLTASRNPFGCELYGFGSIVTLAIGEDSAKITHADLSRSLPLDKFSYNLPDGYVIKIKELNNGTLRLEASLRI